MTLFRIKTVFLAALFGLAAALAAGLVTQPTHAAGVVFRYLPGQPGLSSAVVAGGLTEGPFLDPRTAGVRGPGGWGLAPLQSVVFDGAGTTLRSAADEALRQVIGPNLTAEAWIRPAQIDGQAVLISNQVGTADGFTLGLDAGRPYFALRFNGQSYRVDSDAALTVESNQWVAATARRSGETLVLTVYVDGHRRARATYTAAFTAAYEIARPFYVGTEASGDAAAPSLAGAFSGHLFGAIVRDYVAQDIYLASPVPKDGSAYLGLPGFHDYDLATFHLPMDERISESPLELRHRFYLPFVNDGYVPQGTASHFEVSGGDTTALVYVAYYHMTRNNVAESLPSVVAEIDAWTGHLRRGFRLTGGQISTSHAGGIAYERGALYVSSRQWLERYPLPDYDPDGPVFMDLPAEPSGSMRTGSKASFVSAHDDTLWVGDWRTASDVAPYLFGYPIGDDGRIDPAGRPAIYALPRNIQGVDLFTYGGTRYVFMTRNRGSAAEVMRFKRSALNPYVVPTADTSVTLPYGIEDISFWPDGTMWTNSESGTDYYQRGNPSWSTFFPFVYSIPADVLIPGMTTTSREQGEERLPTGIELRSYPNPAVGAVTITLALDMPGQLRVTVVDLLGRSIATVHEGLVSRGAHAFRWEGGAVSPGLYFVVAEMDGRRVIHSVTRI